MLPIPPCGAYCENCLSYKKRCDGCFETSGHCPLAREQGKDVCPIWECATRRGVDHCGVCGDFPCDIFFTWYNPSRGVVGILRRIGLLAFRKKVGDEAWVKWLQQNKVEFGT